MQRVHGRAGRALEGLGKRLKVAHHHVDAVLVRRVVVDDPAEEGDRLRGGLAPGLAKKKSEFNNKKMKVNQP